MKFKNLLGIFLVVVMTLCLSTSGYADWVAAAGTSADWDVDANWSGVVPVAGDTDQPGLEFLGVGAGVETLEHPDEDILGEVHGLVLFAHVTVGD